MTYPDWAQSHCQTFGLFEPQEVAMVLSWQRPLCEAAGFSVGELQAASVWMASQAAPKFRTDHLRMIQQRVAGERLATAAREHQKRLAESGDDPGSCVKCFGSGWIIVPHLDSIQSGVWVYPWYTCGVYCACQLGRYVEARRAATDAANAAEAEVKRKPKPRSVTAKTIAEYERANPFWEGQIVERDVMLAEMHAAQEAAHAADKKRGPINVKQALAGIGEMPK